MKNLKLRLPVLALAVSLAFGASATLDPKVYLDEIKYLASPALRGRATGSPELEQAAAWLAGKYREAGVPPASPAGYLLPFAVTTSGTLGTGNRFQFTENGASSTLRFPADFVPFQFSSSTRVDAPVVFAGYGITAPEYHYDDYAGMDVKGKIVLVLARTSRNG